MNQNQLQIIADQLIKLALNQAGYMDDSNSKINKPTSNRDFDDISTLYREVRHTNNPDEPSVVLPEETGVVSPIMREPYHTSDSSVHYDYLIPNEHGDFDTLIVDQPSSNSPNNRRNPLSSLLSQYSDSEIDQIIDYTKSHVFKYKKHEGIDVAYELIKDMAKFVKTNRQEKSDSYIKKELTREKDIEKDYPDKVAIVHKIRVKEMDDGPTL